MAKTKNTAKKVATKKTTTVVVKDNPKTNKDFSFNGFKLEKNVISILITLLLVLSAMWYAFDIRSGSLNLDGLDDRVEASILQNLQQVVYADIAQNYPNLNQQFIEEQTIKELNEIIINRDFELQGQSYNLDQLIEVQKYMAKSQFQGDNNQTYLTAIDPYHFLRLSSNYLENGHTGTNIIDGESIIEYKLAPENSIQGKFKPEFHVWLESNLFSLNGLDSNSSFEEKTAAVYLIPSIIASLAVIPIFFFMRLYTNNLIAFFASLILVSIGTFVSRTTAGFVDTDAYQVFFSLSVVTSLLYSFYSKSNLSRLLFGLFSGFLMGMFVWAWGNGWFLFVFSVISLLGYFIYSLITNLVGHKKLSSEFIVHNCFTIISFIISSVLFSWILAGRNIISSSLNGIFGSLSGDIASISSSSIWPNVFSSVAELNPASFAQVISSVGGEFISILALLGILFLILDFKKESSQIKNASNVLLGFSAIYFIGVISGGWITTFATNQKLLFISLIFLPIALGYLISFIGKNTSFKIFISILLSIWMAGTIYMSLNGVRFILLLAPAFAISAATGLYYLGSLISRFISSEFKIKKESNKKIPGMVVVTIIFLIIFAPMATQAKSIGDNAMPNFDDSWYNAMYKIDQESNPNTIITSWWDFGHFFTAVSNRAVTFDGGSQTTPQSHWVGKLFLESDEDISVDILRMLTCGGNLAFETLNEYSQDETGGVHINELLYSTFGKSKEEKIELIRNYKYYNFSEEEINSVMVYLHCDEPRENLVITSGDMVSKAGVWAHWGSWDFTKKFVHSNYNKLSVEEIATILDKNISLIQTYVTELNQIDYQSRSQNINKEQLTNQWFAPYPSYSGNVACQLQNGSIILCENGLEIDSISALILNEDLQGYSFNNVIIPTIDGIYVSNQSSRGGDIDILLTQNQVGSFQAMIMQAPLGTSLFTKLFYLDGMGTTKFEQFDSVQTQTAGKVSVWKTNFGEVEQETTSINSINYTLSPDELEELLESSNSSSQE